MSLQNTNKYIETFLHDENTILGIVKKFNKDDKKIKKEIKNISFNYLTRKALRKFKWIKKKTGK